MIKKSESYNYLCTEFYDVSKPEACASEVAFYESFVSKSKGPILEAMVGSGRLLIPLLKKGYQIDGVDKSAAMLESASKRCEREKLSVNLFHQTLENLSLPQKYDLIFIAVGSFQLISDRCEALKALERLHDHLLPGGVLLLDTFVPWDFVKECVDGEFLSPEPHTSQNQRKVFLPDESEISLKICQTLHPREQLDVTECIYEKRVKGELARREEEVIYVRWYYRYEMELLLERAGFRVDRIWNESFADNPQAVVFQAIKR